MEGITNLGEVRASLARMEAIIEAHPEIAERTASFLSGELPLMEDTMDDIMTVEEAASVLKLHRETLYREIRKGNLEATRTGRVLRLTKEGVERYLKGERPASSEAIGAPGFVQTERILAIGQALARRIAWELIRESTDGQARLDRILEELCDAGMDKEEGEAILDRLPELGEVELHGEALRPTLANFVKEVAAHLSEVEPEGPVVAGEALHFVSQALRAIGWKMSLDTFKARILEAHRERFLVLASPDMPQTLDPKELEASLIKYRNSRYAFIRAKS